MRDKKKTENVSFTICSAFVFVTEERKLRETSGMTRGKKDGISYFHSRKPFSQCFVVFLYFGKKTENSGKHRGKLIHRVL